MGVPYKIFTKNTSSQHNNPSESTNTLILEDFNEVERIQKQSRSKLSRKTIELIRANVTEEPKMSIRRHLEQDGVFYGTIKLLKTLK